MRLYMKKTLPLHGSRNAFTLIELLVVMAVIAVLMSLVIGLSGTANEAALLARAKTELAELILEIEDYKESEGEYPANWAAFNTWYTATYSGTAWTITDGDPSDPIDPWGNTYQYNEDAANDFLFLIGSLGPNGVSDSGEGDDITNRNGALQ